MWGEMVTELIINVSFLLQPGSGMTSYNLRQHAQHPKELLKRLVFCATFWALSFVVLVGPTIFSCGTMLLALLL